jgi:hypothetical protein
MAYLEDQSLAARIGLSAITLLIAYALWSNLTNPLNKYPGPFLASKCLDVKHDLLHRCKTKKPNKIP